MELDAVAHGNHGFSAHIIVKDVMHRLAGAMVNDVGHRRKRRTLAARPDESSVKATAVMSEARTLKNRRGERRRAQWEPVRSDSTMSLPSCT